MKKSSLFWILDALLIFCGNRGSNSLFGVRKLGKWINWIFWLIIGAGTTKYTKSQPEYSSLVSELKELQEFQFTVWDTFDIRKSLIIEYFSSMISFNVLILQLQPVSTKTSIALTTVNETMN